MDDFERAILISFNQTVDANLKAQAIGYCQQLKQSATIVQACLEKLRSCNYGEVQFWCLQTLEELLRQRSYGTLGDHDRGLIRTSLMGVVCTENEQRPVFIRNKLAQVVVLLVSIDYPNQWPSAFVELLSYLQKGPFVVDMFCRILNALDEEVISLDFPRKPDEIALATRLKDAMRQQCVPQIAGAWYNLVVVYRNAKPELAASVLDTMARFISWIDIGLVANDSFMPLLFEILVSPQEPIQLRGAAADCLHAIVSKGMDASAKLGLLQQLRLGAVCDRMRDLNDVDFAAKFSGLLTGFAAEVLECSKKLDANGVTIVPGMLDEILPSVFYFVQHDDEDISASTFQFLSNYVNRMKVGRPLTGNQAAHIGHILEVIRYRMRYGAAYNEALDAYDRDGEEEEARVEGYRKELFSLFKNIYRVAPDVTRSFVKNVLAAMLGNPETPFEEVEAAITLLYKLGEGLPEDALKASTGDMQEMLGAVLTMTIPCCAHRVVTIAYLETVIRYVKFLHYHEGFIPAALAAFLDARGIQHPNPHVNSRASYLFVRLVKALRPQLVPYIDSILQSLRVIMCISPKKIAPKDAMDDRNYIFEAIGLLVGAEEVPGDKQESLLSAVLGPLYGQVDATLASRAQGAVGILQQVILAITHLSKGFTEQLLVQNRSALGSIFRQSVDVVLRILIAYPEAEILRSKVISFLHRMVDVLGASVFPFLPTAIQQLLLHSEPKDLVEFVHLLNQLISKFKVEMSSILQEIFPSVIDRAFILLPKGALPEVSLSNTEEYRELQELQKVLLNLVQALAANNLSSVLLFQSSERLNDIFQMLLSCACSHKDLLARKVCVQVLSRLASDWCGNTTVMEKVPGFNRFMIERFAADCCIRSSLHNSFNLNDAQTASLVGDIVSAQKILYEKCGEEFLMQMGSAILPSLRCPPNLAEEYCLHIQRSDSKSLKAFFRNFIEQLRAVQYGNGQR